MTYAEMKAELNTIYENINKNGAPGLDDYEISVILTHAQELLVKGILENDPSASTLPQLITTHIDSSGSTSYSYSWGTTFTVPTTGILKVLNEELIDSHGVAPVTYTIVPITNIEFDIKQSKPYHYPRRRTAWRLPILGTSTEDEEVFASPTTPSVEVFARPGTTLSSYKMRYVRKPRPIIVTDLQTLSPFAMGVVATYTSTAGTGYSVGDVLTLVGGTLPATFRVLALTGSGVASVGMITNGYGMTAGTKETTPVPPSGGSGCQITITIANASTIDGEYSPRDSELDPALHRDILKIASTLAEQYYYDKYGTESDK
jgi:hypothetical protein